MKAINQKKLFELFEHMTSQGQNVVVDINKTICNKNADIFLGGEDFKLKLIDNEKQINKEISLSDIFENSCYFIITISSQGYLKSFTPIFSGAIDIHGWLRYISDFYGMKLLDNSKRRNIKFWKIRMDEIVYLINYPRRK